MEVYVFGFLILGFLASHVSTYSNGLVYKSCDTMMPQHGTSVPQTTEPPYSVSASSYFYRPANKITVTIQANPGAYFEGFLLQARTIQGNEIAGHFIVTDPKSQNLTCHENVYSSVTHKDSSKKSNISALWVAPASVSGVIFKATILQSKRTFWVGVESPELTVSSNSNTTSSPVAASDTSSPPSSSTADNGRIQFHGPGIFASDTKVNLSVTSNVTHTENNGLTMVKTHGALMLIAWMTTGSLGMIIARYCKTAAKKPILGKALWFQAHMVFMVLTVAATIVAFVLSFVVAKGWSYGNSTHAIIGCIVMILTIFQPLIGFFRPSPQSSKRYFFNVFHGVNALLVKVLAVANLILGLQLIDYRLGWMVNVMGGFVGWEALAIIIFEINNDLAQKEIQKLSDTESTKALIKTEVYLLLIYLCGNLTFLIALLVGIGKA